MRLVGTYNPGAANRVDVSEASKRHGPHAHSPTMVTIITAAKDNLV
jgi:hypothetical protein